MLGILLKGIGALCVVAAGGLAGWRKGEQVMRRVQVLEEMIGVLSAVKNNLQFQRDRTYDVLYGALRTDENRFLHLPWEILRDGPQMEDTLSAMLEQMRKAHEQELPAQELDWFCAALRSLGKCPAGQAEQKLAYAAAQLSDTLHTARREAAQQQKLYRTVGLSFGGVAALLLL